MIVNLSNLNIINSFNNNKMNNYSDVHKLTKKFNSYKKSLKKLNALSTF